MKTVNQIQKALITEDLNGWLLCGFKSQNSIPNGIFKLEPSTRKFFIFIPKLGKPTIIFSTIESHLFCKLPFKKHTFITRSEMVDSLLKAVPQKGRIAIESSSFCNLPSVSLVDHGTVEFLEQLFPEVEFVASADIIQTIVSSWTTQGFKNHCETAERLNQIKDKAFKFISLNIKNNNKITEQDVQKIILDEFGKFNMVTDHPPVVASGKNTSNPHFATESSPKKFIKRNELVLIDLWAKLNKKGSIFADITWMGFTGEKIPDDILKSWNSVKDARNITVKFVKKKWCKKEIVRGFEIDDVCRQSLIKAGLDKFFIHRTGHSIDKEAHGKGVNLDNFESHDDRKLIPNIGFSIEPGVYLSDFGIRSEINMFIDLKKGPLVTTLIQNEVIKL